jgi:hypothetical protein
MTTRAIAITPNLAFGADHPPLFIAGPCVIEGLEHALKMARILAALRDELKINLVFKSSFDKANRSSIDSFRGPGVEAGMEDAARGEGRDRVAAADRHSRAVAGRAGGAKSSTSCRSRRFFAGRRTSSPRPRARAKPSA